MNAAAFTGSPLVNLVPGLILKVQVLPSELTVFEVARAGTTLPSGVGSYSPVKRLSVTRMPSDSCALYGSMATGSVIPILKVPPALAEPLPSPPPLSSPPPQAVAARPMTIAPATHLALLAPRMGSSS